MDTLNQVVIRGWYRDPYGRHEDRYFSDGTPTKLVRDGDREAFDPPPDLPLPGPLLRSAHRPPRRPGPGDLHRADECEREPAFDWRVARDKAISTAVRCGAGR